MRAITRGHVDFKRYFCSLVISQRGPCGARTDVLSGWRKLILIALSAYLSWMRKSPPVHMHNGGPAMVGLRQQLGCFRVV